MIPSFSTILKSKSIGLIMEKSIISSDSYFITTNQVAIVIAS